MLNRIKNSNGMGLVEVLTMVTIGTIAMFAALNFMTNSTSSQREVQARQTATRLKTRFSSLLENSQAWNMTVANNPTTMACLADTTTPCVPGTYNFDIYDGSNPTIPFYRSLANPTATGYGFNEAGDACPGPTDHQGPPAGSACPFGYVLQWQPDCPGGPCSNPRVKIMVTPVFWSNKPGVLLNTTNYGIGLGTDLYYRNATARHDSFSLADMPPLPYAPGMGGGTCVGTAQRNLVVNSDPYNMVQMGNDGAGPPYNASITFKIVRAGTYKCSVSGAGFAVDQFKLKLMQGATELASGTSYAPQWIQTTATFDAIFTVPANTTLSLAQDCSTFPTAVPGYALGVPAGNFYGYTQNTFASIVCTQID